MPSGSSVQPAADLALAELRTAQYALAANIAQFAINLILLIVTAVSVYFAFRAYYHQKERAKKDAACELARYYAHDIIQRYDFVSYTFQHSKKEEKIKELFPYDRLKNFDYKEMTDILAEQGHDVQKTMSELFRIEPHIIYQGMIRNARSVEERHSLCDEYIKETKDSAGNKVTEILHQDMLMLAITNEVTMLLNDLEWFSMSCRYGLADEEMLYQSLHLTFLSSVWLLYQYICFNNRENTDKLFTNVIWLFNKWADRLRAIEKEAQEEAEQYSQKIEAKKKDLEETERKARQVEPKVHAGKGLK